MPIQITAKRDGFRRCGIAHSDKTQTYADDHFTAAQLQALKAEDQLVVVHLSDQQLSAGGTGEGNEKLEVLRSQLLAATSSLDAKTAELTTAQSLIEKLNDDLSQANTDLTAKQETITAQQAEIEALKAQVISLTPSDDKAKK